jgi:dihydropteroate synthase
MNSARGRDVVEGLPDWDRCAVMGVINVTPDSFSDTGRWFDTGAALKHGLDLVVEGADLVDVGGESTRPGASRVDEEEPRRVIPVVRGPAAEGVVVSVDTMRATAAEQAIEAGAVLVNDVSGGLADPAMVPVVAAADIPFVVMHWRGFSHEMNSRAVYEDVVREVSSELRSRVDAVVSGGVAPGRLALAWDSPC